MLAITHRVNVSAIPRYFKNNLKIQTSYLSSPVLEILLEQSNDKADCCIFVTVHENEILKKILSNNETLWSQYYLIREKILLSIVCRTANINFNFENIFC